MNVWFIGDTHFNHANIIKYEQRQFKDVETMNMSLISNWNNTVKKSDKIFVLGDVAFYDAQNIIPLLNGHKILVMGNHDKKKTVKWWLDTGFKEVSQYPIIYNGWILSHEPYVSTEFKNIYAHLHSSGICDQNRYCVSVELHDYKPVNIKTIIKHFN